MAHAEFYLQIGDVSFRAAGEQEAVDQALQYMPAQLLAALQNPRAGDKQNAGGSEGASLKEFLHASHATTRPSRRFLTTLAWLHSLGTRRVHNIDITEAFRREKLPRIVALASYARDAQRQGRIKRYKDGAYRMTAQGYEVIASNTAPRAKRDDAT